MDREPERSLLMISWRKDIDAAFEEARKTGRVVFADFNAAPL
jgi:hypothetical protein